MKCQFCAEEIHESALVCKHCGAAKENGAWMRAGVPGSHRPKGRTTLMSAAVLFVASGLFELFSLRSPVPLLGAMRGGAVAVIAHLVDTTLFVVLGIGIFARRRWGYRFVFAGTALYSLERLLYLMDHRGREAELLQTLGSYVSLSGYLDTDLILSVMALTTSLFIASAWGFAAYVYFRRDYFRAESARR